MPCLPPGGRHNRIRVLLPSGAHACCHVERSRDISNVLPLSAGQKQKDVRDSSTSVGMTGAWRGMPETERDQTAGVPYFVFRLRLAAASSFGSSIVPRQFALPHRQANSFSSFFVRRSAGTIL